jgi:hypothetical protein
MAIIGDLSDLPFPEIFNAIGDRTGRLLIGAPGRLRFELEVHGGALRGLRVGDERIDDPLRAREELLPLLEADGGVFAFHRAARGDLEGALHLPIPPLLLGLASALDEIAAYRDRFAGARARFRLAATGPELSEPLEHDLAHFLERASGLLHRGADAEELSQTLGLGLDPVRFRLHKLRALGRVCALQEPQAVPRLAAGAA